MLVNLHWLGDHGSDGIRSLRSVRTDTTLEGNRRGLYLASLSQAEELWQSASAVTTLASPLLRYYAVLQASWAVMAASPLKNSEWRPIESHGLRVQWPAAQRFSLMDVRVSPLNEGAVSKLAKALDSPLFQEEMSLEELIAALPSQQLIHRRDDIASALDIQIDLADSELMIKNAPPRFFTPDPASENGWLSPSLDDVRSFMNLYPALFTFPDPTRVSVSDGQHPTDAYRMSINWRPIKYNPHEWKESVDVWSWNRRHDNPDTDLATILPAVGRTATRPQHPLVTWFCVLHAFSILARYHPERWRRMLDVETNVEAVVLERLIDWQSEDALDLVQIAIREFVAESVNV